MTERKIPGLWRCLRCGFFLVRGVISAHTGQLGVNDKPPTEPCPNDGELLVPETEPLQ